MAKRTFAVLLVSLCAGVPAAYAAAQPVPVAVDGCAKLARVVYAEVSAAAIYGPGKSGPWIIDLARGDIAVCPHAAKTVSQAFTSAMLTAGLDVNWRRDGNDGPRDPGDYCLSGFLSQCYPNQRPPLSNAIYSANDTLVQKTWAVVSQAVIRDMYNPFSSDEVRFRDNDLKLRLGLSLRTIDDRLDNDRR
jgi:hypothetical protein